MINAPLKPREAIKPSNIFTSREEIEGRDLEDPFLSFVGGVHLDTDDLRLLDNLGAACSCGGYKQHRNRHRHKEYDDKDENKRQKEPNTEKRRKRAKTLRCLSVMREGLRLNDIPRSCHVYSCKMGKQQQYSAAINASPKL